MACTLVTSSIALALTVGVTHGLLIIGCGKHRSPSRWTRRTKIAYAPESQKIGPEIIEQNHLVMRGMKSSGQRTNRESG